MRALPDKPEETSVATVRALWQLAAGQPMSARLATARTLPSLGPAERTRLRALVRERLSGMPLAHQTGRQSFMGIEMLAGPEALIPRPETELLAGAAIDPAAAGWPTHGRPVIVVDVCTGSGNLAVALALAEPRAIVYASDLSAEAVALARRNVAHLGLGDRVEPARRRPAGTVRCRAGSGARSTCSPATRPTSPRPASTPCPARSPGMSPPSPSTAGRSGYAILQRLIREAPRLLRPGGWLALEVGAGQGPAVEQRLRKSGDYAGVEGVMDPTGQIRAIVAERRTDP